MQYSRIVEQPVARETQNVKQEEKSKPIFRSIQPT